MHRSCPMSLSREPALTQHPQTAVADFAVFRAVCEPKRLTAGIAICLASADVAGCCWASALLLLPAGSQLWPDDRGSGRRGFRVAGNNAAAAAGSYTARRFRCSMGMAACRRRGCQSKPAAASRHEAIQDHGADSPCEAHKLGVSAVPQRNEIQEPGWPVWGLPLLP